VRSVGTAIADQRLMTPPLSLRPTHLVAVVWGLLVSLSACADAQTIPPSADIGPAPRLAEPNPPWIPTVDIAPAVGWPQGAKPTPAAGLDVIALATDLDHPRWLAVLPNGDVLVAETNAPPRPEQGKGVKGWVMKMVMKRAGAGVPSANRITLLRDADHDGRAETRSVFLEGLNSPFGMALVGDKLYVANTDSVLEFAYTEGATRIAAPGRKVADLPAGPLNHHWTKNLIASADGSKLYVTVGSNSNVADKGMAVEEGRAAIWEVIPATGAKRLFASGLRNPNGLAWEPQTGMLWTVVNERDELGNDLVPDYLTSVREAGFYGWPYSWYGHHVDERVEPGRPDLVARAIVPDYALGSHVAPLGLAAARDDALTRMLAPATATALTATIATTATTPSPAGMFVGLHGSWNRKPLSGYKVIFVPFTGGRPAGLPVDVLTGFVSPDGDAFGRPVGVAMAQDGALLVADDVGNTVWRVAPR
jgi:glucose/arabinose dehydrogenase